MSLSTEALFTAALGLQAPWRVERAELNTDKRRIDFDVICTERRLACPHCAALDQGIHERVAVRRACESLTLKVILNTGEMADDALITQAAQIAPDAGADFLKTSTGKRPVSATPTSARLLLQAIVAASLTQRTRVGFKPAGGIRTVADAAVYMTLTAEWLGPDVVTPTRFRIGVSDLLDDIEAVLSGAPHPAPGSAY